MASTRQSIANELELSQNLNSVSIDEHLVPSSAYLMACSSSGNEGPYYGRFASLYHILDPSIIPQLEQAILYGDVRAFQESSELFEKISKEFKYHPIIALEHAHMLWRQWSLLDCRKVLESALAWGQQNAKDVKDHGIYTLLRVLLGKLVVFTKGDFTQARDSMKEIRTWLARYPISKYSDIEVYEKKAKIQAS